MVDQLMARSNEPGPQDMWRIFRIMAEFVDGFETMARVGPAVAVFGSARTRPDDKYYKMAEDLGRALAKRNFGVITGGGPGIMEAANKGAREVEGGVSIGMNISLPMEQKNNAYQNISVNHHYFFVRKVMFVKYSHAFVCFPGGFGTMDEFFESLTLIQTLKIDPFPVVLIGSEFWSGLIEWLRETMLERFGYIHGKDLNLFRIMDDVEEAAEVIAKCEAGKCWITPEQPPVMPTVVSARAQEVSAEGTRYGISPKPADAVTSPVSAAQNAQDFPQG